MTQNITKVIGYTKIFERTRSAKKPIVINVGGARSSKSYSIAQVIVEKLVTERGKKVLITRKTFPALRLSTMLPFIDMLKDYGLYLEDNHNRTFNSLTVNGNFVQFASLDESEKIKSSEWHYIWMEEGNEYSYDEYVALKLRLSGKCLPGEANHLYMSLNPVDANNWIATRASKETDVDIIRSTYLDNPYLSKEYVKLLTDLISQDENSYRVYVLGEWGLLEGKIYTNYKVIPELPMMTGAKWAYGLDFGLVNPSAIIKVYLFGDKFYLEERLYKAGLTNADLIEHFSHEERGDIYADPSAKQMIVEISRAGYSAFEGHKEVKEGIDLCQRQPLFIPQQSVNLIREIQNYHWKKDKNASGEEAFIAEPVKYNDHLCDAFRYAIWGVTERFGFPTQRPRTTEAIKSLTFAGDGTGNRVIDRWMKRN